MNSLRLLLLLQLPVVVHDKVVAISEACCKLVYGNLNIMMSISSFLNKCRTLMGCYAFVFTRCAGCLRVIILGKEKPPITK